MFHASISKTNVSRGKKNLWFNRDRTTGMKLFEIFVFITSMWSVGENFFLNKLIYLSDDWCILFWITFSIVMFLDDSPPLIQLLSIEQSSVLWCSTIDENITIFLFFLKKKRRQSRIDIKIVEAAAAVAKYSWRRKKSTIVKFSKNHLMHVRTQ